MNRWNIVNTANKNIKEEIIKKSNWHYVDINKDMFTEAGEIKAGMFDGDG